MSLLEKKVCMRLFIIATKKCVALHSSRKHNYQWPAAQSFSLCRITTSDFNYIVALMIHKLLRLTYEENI